MKALIEKIGRIGTDASTSPAELRSIRVTNISAAFVSLTSVLYIASGLAQGLYPIVLFGSLQLVAFLGVIAFSAMRLHRPGRIFYSGVANALMAMNSITQGRASDAYLYYIPVVVGVWLIFPAEESGLALGLSLAGVVMFVLFDFGVIGAQPLIHVTPAQLDSISHSNRIINLAVLFVFAYYSFRAVNSAEAQLDEERAKSENLLLNILPRSIADRLKAKRGSIADRFDEATILFADIVDFTKLAERTPPGELIDLLDRIFTRFDELAARFGLEKIKTIGDAYMVAGGLPDPREDHAQAIARMALAMQDAAAALGVAIRIGIHTGPVVAGVIGQRKFAYDLWGDSVNTASRMESHGQPGRIHVSRDVYEKLKAGFAFEARGTVNVKGKGELETYFLVAETPVPIGHETPVPPSPQ